MTLRRLFAFIVTLAAFGGIAQASAASTGKLGSGCIAHHPNYVEGTFEVQYAAGCSGHDEPELDPVSSAPGSAQDLTWRFVLPSDGSFNVSATGPTFWFGGTVTDPAQPVWRRDSWRCSSIRTRS